MKLPSHVIQIDKENKSDLFLAGVSCLPAS